MPTPIPPVKLNPETPYKDILAYINTNFENVVTSVNDIGAKFSQAAAYSTITLAAGTQTTLTLNITDPANEYTVDKLSINPRFQIFIDTDANYSYLLAGGGLLTNEMINCTFSWWQTRVVPTGSPTNTKAVVYALLKNNGASPHNYYITVDAAFTAGPQTGIFR